MYVHNHHFIKRQINTLFLFQVEVILFFNITTEVFWLYFLECVLMSFVCVSF